MGYYAITVLIGCIHQPIRTRTPIPPDTESSMARDSGRVTPGHSLEIFTPGSVRYDYRAIATIQSTLGDTVPRIDSTQVTAVLTAMFAADSTQALVNAITRVDSLQVRSPTISYKPSPHVEPIVVRIDRQTGRLLAHAPGSLDCTETTPELMFQGDEVTPVLLRSSVTKKTWTDTAIVTVCRSGILMRLTKERTSHIDSQITSTNETRVIRLTSLKVTGTGSLWHQRVSVSGHGTSTDTLILAGQPTRLQRVSTKSEMMLTFQSEIRTQRFLQLSSTTITARPPK